MRGRGQGWEGTVVSYLYSHWVQGPHSLSWFRRDVCTWRLQHVCSAQGVWVHTWTCEMWGQTRRGLFWKPVCGVSHRHHGSGGEPFIVLTIIFPFASHLASLFINIRGTCKLEHAEMLSFGQEYFQRAPCCSERVLSSWLHWTVEQAKRC